MFLLLIEDDDRQFHWEIWKIGREKEKAERLNKGSLEDVAEKVGIDLNHGGR